MHNSVEANKVTTRLRQHDQQGPARTVQCIHRPKPSSVIGSMYNQKKYLAAVGVSLLRKTPTPTPHPCLLKSKDAPVLPSIAAPNDCCFRAPCVTHKVISDPQQRGAKLASKQACIYSLMSLCKNSAKPGKRCTAIHTVKSAQPVVILMLNTARWEGLAKSKKVYAYFNGATLPTTHLVASQLTPSSDVRAQFASLLSLDKCRI